MFQHDFFRDLVVVFEFQGFAKLESVLDVPRIASGIVQKESQILRCAVVIIKPLQILIKNRVAIKFSSREFSARFFHCEIQMESDSFEVYVRL